MGKRICKKFKFNNFSNWSDAIFQPTEEQVQLRNMLRKFVQQEIEPQALKYNRTETFNDSLFQKFGTNTISTTVALIHEELSYSDPALCLSYLAHSILFINNLYINGNEEQCLKWLPSACSGKLVCGMGMSEASGGTDVLGGMRSTARYDKGNDTFVLNGSKMWITNGTTDGTNTGDLFLVYAKTGEKKTDITQFVIEKDMVGFKLGQKINDKCGMRSSPTA